MEPYFSSCLHPQFVLNPYTRQRVMYPCGKCKQCIMRKHSRLAYLCRMESATHKYNVFVTLTYDPVYAPFADVVLNEELSEHSYDGFVYDMCDENGEYLGSFTYPEPKLKLLFHKVGYIDRLPYLRKRDLQLFIKRFRKYVSEKTESKVRYFAVGEYGPAHFWPHYHLLLSFDDKTLLQVCEEYIRKAWRYGRVDCQLSKGACANYVANYVNSSGDVPPPFTLSSTKGFYLRSQKLGFGFFEGERRKVYETSPTDFIKRSLIIDGVNKEFYMWSSLYNVFFPKCRGFFAQSHVKRVYSYRLYETARRIFPECKKTIEIARSIASFLIAFGNNLGNCMLSDDEYDFYRYFDTFYQCYEVRDAEFKYIPSRDAALADEHAKDSFVQSIYSDLLLSKHFLTYVCDHQTTYEIERKVRLIEEFYKVLDLQRLNNFYKSQQLYFNEDFADEDDLIFFYRDCEDMELDARYRSLYSYRVYSSEVDKLYQKRIKHKYANDLNKIFL